MVGLQHDSGVCPSCSVKSREERCTSQCFYVLFVWVCSCKWFFSTSICLTCNLNADIDVKVITEMWRCSFHLWLVRAENCSDSIVRTDLFAYVRAIRARTFPLGKKEQCQRKKINVKYKVVSGKDY